MISPEEIREAEQELERVKMAYIIKKWTTASVQVVYYIPDYLNLINEFIWQTRDQQPDYPRINQFLDYWDKNIDASERAFIYDHEDEKLRVVDRTFKIN